MMDDYINRQAAIEIIQNMYPGMPKIPWMIKKWKKKYEPYIRLEEEIKALPSAQPEKTFIGYGTYKPDILSEYLRLRNEKLPENMHVNLDIQKITKHKSDFSDLDELSSAQPNTSRIENALHRKSAEEQYDFIWWLMQDYGMQFTDTKAAVIKWLRGEYNE